MKQRLERGSKMNKKGFTLIELLAVIVILAIIALIAVPVAMNIINKANKSAFKDSAYGLIKAGELFYTDQLLENAGLYEDKTFTFPNDTEGLEIKGSKPTGGYVTVNKKGQVSMAVTNGKYCVTKGFEDEDVKISDNIENCGKVSEKDKIGKPVYYNPNKALLCTETQWINNVNKNGKSGCMRWYVYGSEGDSLKLILDHNTTHKVYWNSTGENLDDYVTVRAQLENDTGDWKVSADIISTQDILELLPWYQKLEDKSDARKQYSIDFYLSEKELENEFVEVEISNIKEAQSYAHMLSNHPSGMFLPKFLYDDIYEACTYTENYDLNCPSLGYWLKDEVSSSVYRADSVFVFILPSLANGTVVNDELGLRPVIRIKDNIEDKVEDFGTSTQVYKIGKPVYYNPNKALLCTETQWINNVNKNGKSGCMRWYVYSIEGNKQKLILDHNTTATVAWISEADYNEANTDGTSCSNSACNDEGPLTLMRQLEADTKNWKIEADIVDTFDIVKLIPYFQELEDINTWQENWNEYYDLYHVSLQDSMLNVPQSEYNSVDAYLDAILDYGEENHLKLSSPRELYRDLMYEYLITNENPTTYGYWTKTADALHPDEAWFVAYSGNVVSNCVFYSDAFGLRPVITLSK